MISNGTDNMVMPVAPMYGGNGGGCGFGNGWGDGWWILLLLLFAGGWNNGGFGGGFGGDGEVLQDSFLAYSQLSPQASLMLKFLDVIELLTL